MNGGHDGRGSFLGGGDGERFDPHSGNGRDRFGDRYGSRAADQAYRDPHDAVRHTMQQLVGSLRGLRDDVVELASARHEAIGLEGPHQNPREAHVPGPEHERHLDANDGRQQRAEAAAHADATRITWQVARLRQEVEQLPPNDPLRAQVRGLIETAHRLTDDVGSLDRHSGDEMRDHARGRHGREDADQRAVHNDHQAADVDLRPWDAVFPTGTPHPVHHADGLLPFKPTGAAANEEADTGFGSQPAPKPGEEAPAGQASPADISAGDGEQVAVEFAMVDLTQSMRTLLDSAVEATGAQRDRTSLADSGHHPEQVAPARAEWDASDEWRHAASVAESASWTDISWDVERLQNYVDRLPEGDPLREQAVELLGAAARLTDDVTLMHNKTDEADEHHLRAGYDHEAGFERQAGYEHGREGLSDDLAQWGRTNAESELITVEHIVAALPQAGQFQRPPSDGDDQWSVNGLDA